MLLVFMDFGGVSSVPLTTVGNASMQGVGTELGTVALGMGILGRTARRSRGKSGQAVERADHAADGLVS
jgi:hypothetical protein